MSNEINKEKQRTLWNSCSSPFNRATVGSGLAGDEEAEAELRRCCCISLWCCWCWCPFAGAGGRVRDEEGEGAEDLRDGLPRITGIWRGCCCCCCCCGGSLLLAEE